MPPLAHRTTKVTLSGTCFNGTEVWSTGFWLGYENGDADLPNQQLADDIRAAWTTFFTSANSYIASGYKFTQCKVASLGTDGKSNPIDSIYSYPPATVSGGGGASLPPQIALVATLQAGVPRGVASKGRMYLPGVSQDVESSGKLAQIVVTNIANGLKTFFTAVNASTATNNVVVNASHGSLNADGTPRIGGSSPITRAVTSVKVGDVYDTQRRRRNGLVEVYQTAMGPF